MYHQPTFDDLRIADEDNVWELYNGESTNNRELNTPLPTVSDFEEMAQMPIPDDSLDYDEILDMLDEYAARRAPESPQPDHLRRLQSPQPGPSHRPELPQPGSSHRPESLQPGPSHRPESPQPGPSHHQETPNHSLKRKETDDATNPNKRTLFESR